MMINASKIPQIAIQKRVTPIISLSGSHHKTSHGGSTRAFTSINCNTPYNLCFLRHGQSTWNRDNRFIGWTDTPLTEDGVLEARVAGRMLRSSGLLFDEAHTSLLRRSIRTVNLVLMEMGQEYIPVHKHWRLNERSYGDLVGLNKKEVVKQFGKDQVKRWRRSYDEPPPMMRADHDHHPIRDPRYRLVSTPIAFAIFSDFSITKMLKLTYFVSRCKMKSLAVNP
jgi:bisphosphoglycerate-dependent phosphoglycerate mutase family 1